MYKCNAGNFGGVGLRIVFCAVSLVVLGAAIFFLLRNFSSKKTSDVGVAHRLSDMGIEEGMKKLAESHHSWSTEFEDEPFEEGGGKFRVEFTHEERDGVPHITVTSAGIVGTTIRTKSETIKQRVTEDGGTFWVNENEPEPAPLEETDEADIDSAGLTENTEENDSEN